MNGCCFIIAAIVPWQHTLQRLQRVLQARCISAVVEDAKEKVRTEAVEMRPEDRSVADDGAPLWFTNNDAEED